MVRIFIDNQLDLGDLNITDRNILNHIQALRLKPLEIITIFNGNGRYAHARIDIINKKNINLNVIQLFDSSQSEKKSCLAISVIHNDKMDLIIQKAVELGVNQIIPVYTNYSQRIDGNRLSNRLDHWQKIIISSMEQCGQNYLPQISTPITLENLLNNPEHKNLQKIVLATKCDQSNFKLAKTSTIVLVGPEGGFNDSEMQLITSSGYQSMSLGSLTLRSETAAIVSLGIINFTT